MKPPLVLSVPHTGTMFTFDLLPGTRGHLRDGIKEGYKYWTHIGEAGARDAARQCFTVVPMRKFSAVRESWLRRGMDVQRLYSLWTELATVSADFVLQIDSPDRDAQLNALSVLIGMPLATDWQPTNRHAA